MINYVFIILSTFCYSAQFAFSKLFERGTKQTATTSLIMLVVTGGIGALLFLCVGGFKVQCNARSLFWAIAMAGLMIPYYMIGIKVLSLGSLAVYSMFMMLGGMLVPFFYGLVFLQEGMSWGKLVGSVLLTGCIVLQAYSQREDKQTENKHKTLFFVLCLIIFFINGMTGVVSKAHQIHPTAVDEISFTILYCLLTAIFALLFLIGLFLTGQKQEKLAQAKSVFTVQKSLVMASIGTVAYTGNFLALKATVHVPASVQFPIVSGGTIVLSALVSTFIFKEKISKKEWLCVVGAFLATFLFAF